ncbi:hypothetical protein LSUE1_G002987 [Lachnellula suecica]|uniref:Rhodopsin domain-containing protein n=1 Tax=Lachnellula suecica TaxID=602035 RepID=A0A8T9CMQ7_9HELO|nr:hypothetical protein LSUE1_G002987 [Lachnellula suecica]
MDIRVFLQSEHRLVLKNGLQGNDRHQWDVSKAAAIELGKRGNTIEIVYGPVMWLAKASLLFQLIQIFSSTSRSFTYWLIHSTIWINFGFYLGLPFSVYFQCTPREKIWVPITPGTCINVEVYFVATGAFNILSDLTILVLPIWVIWHLQMPVKQKFGVSAVFATGTL